MNLSDPPYEYVAIIGMAGRFPQAINLEEFWDNLRDGVESITFFNDEEARESLFGGQPPKNNPNFVKARAILEDADLFDATFFGINPNEAEIMDPQHRLFLECAWEALEHAGYNPDTYDGLIGLFAGASTNTYLLSNLLTNRERIKLHGGFQTMVANDKDYLPTRVSYKLNLRGPSLNVQTACSTSLVAVCLACQNLLNYQCDMALAGGVSLTFPQKSGQLHEEGGIISPDGHCRAFDADAAGTVSGEGIGIVVLKRLSDALADADTICAIIKGCAINNDGSMKIGYTAPSIDGPAEVVAMAHANAGVHPETISYLETHGTGTQMGDPIEIVGLTKAFRSETTAKGFCAIGSLKTNIGHLDAAAGVAGLIKTVLALQHRQLPPSLHFHRPNPKIDFASSPFYVNDKLRDWQTRLTPRRAGVSSFGIGGTNAHVVLEEAPPAEPPGDERGWQLLALSAKTESALETATTNLAEHLRKNPGINLADVAFTLLVGRKPFGHRRMVVAENPRDAVETLASRDPKRVVTGRANDTEPPLVFMFSGQGTEQVNQAREIYDTEPVFREHMDQCCDLLKPHLDLDLRAILYSGADQAEEAARRLAQPFISQPALFVIEYALAQLWMSWGVRPQAMIGHSLGEYVAACLAKVFSIEDALALVAARGRLVQKHPGGAMLAIRLPEHETKPLLGRRLALAAVNGPELCVASGPVDAIEGLEKKLHDRNVACRRLQTSHALHSEMMEPVLHVFMTKVRKTKLNPPQIPYVSNLTGHWITAPEATNPNYWAAHLRQTVRFADGLAELARGQHEILLEVGPGQSLTTLAQKHPNVSAAQVVVASLGHAKQQMLDRARILNALGRLWLTGLAVPGPGFYARQKRRRLPLPTYPFERKRYWVEPANFGVNDLPVGRTVAPGQIRCSPGKQKKSPANAGLQLHTAPINRCELDPSELKAGEWSDPDLSQADGSPGFLERYAVLNTTSGTAPMAFRCKRPGRKPAGIHDIYFHSGAPVQLDTRFLELFKVELLPINYSETPYTPTPATGLTMCLNQAHRKVQGGFRALSHTDNRLIALEKPSGQEGRQHGLQSGGELREPILDLASQSPNCTRLARYRQDRRQI
jgi:acyl transferase domain-containing protein